MEDNVRNYLPPGIVKFDYQVAGHSDNYGNNLSGILKTDDGLILKPLIKFPAGDNEVKFYEESSKSEEMKILREFIPKYYGTSIFKIHDKDIKFLKLQDVTIGFRKPCIMDIKVGAQTWEPSASYAKREAEAKKYTATKKAYGFCIPGYHVYDVLTWEFKKVGKAQNKLLTKETLPYALREFFNYNSGYSKFLIQCYLYYLKKLLAWWKNQKLYHFYSSSLLFIYDAFMLKDIKKCQIDFVQPLPWIKLYCIDFAHVVPAENTSDSNYISGLQNLIDLLESMINC